MEIYALLECADTCAVATSVFLLVRFRDARMALPTCKNTVGSAAGQVECCVKRAKMMPGDAGIAAVLA